MTQVPSSARAVVVGGGIIGCSTAYHLAHLGWTDTVLVERDRLTCGTTFHAAGLVGQLRSHANTTQLLGYSVDLYRRLEAETGQATGWRMNGGLRLACNAERWEEVKRQATTATSFGLEMHLLSPREAQEIWPLMVVDDVVGAALLPTDGQASPSDITMALAKGAKMAGATIVEQAPVERIEVVDGSIRAVTTSLGRIECEVVVLCAGQWTRQLATSIGVSVPLASVEHQYLVTEPMDVPRDLPTLRDPDRLTYYKEEVGGLVMGGYEPNPKRWVDGVPDDFTFQLLDPDWDQFAPIMELAIGRVPRLAEVGIKRLFNGPESFTPDGMFILGEAPELRNCFVGAGFNAFGIAAGGGAGMALAEWVVNGGPPYDLFNADIRRFGRHHRSVDWSRQRTLEAYAKHYTMAWPFEEHESGRPCRRSPLYDRLLSQGACFGEKLGWERPNWFADVEAGETPRDIYSYGRQNWFEAVGREHRAIRQAAGVIDQTSFAKFVLKGPDAFAALEWICSNSIDKLVGSLTYTQMLDDRGGIQCDLSVARTAEQQFMIVTGTGFATHDFDWIARNIPCGSNAQLVDVTSSTAVLALMGPASRVILAELTDDDISDAGFPFGTLRAIHVAGCPVDALRITFVGELGYELHVPVEFAVTVYESLRHIGRRYGLVNAGYRAIESCRLEKGYRVWGTDIGPDHSPIEAGMAWAVKDRGEVDFRGRQAIARQRRDGVHKRLAGFTADPTVVLHGRETIYRDGERVGWLSSAGFGYTVGRSIGYGYVRNPDGVTSDYIKTGTYELDVATERVPASVSLEPLYDPTSSRVRS